MRTGYVDRKDAERGIRHALIAADLHIAELCKELGINIRALGNYAVYPIESSKTCKVSLTAIVNAIAKLSEGRVVLNTGDLLVVWAPKSGGGK